MGFFNALLEIIGLGIGITFGLFLGFMFFVYDTPSKNVKDPITRALYTFDSNSILDLLPEVPFWIKHSDYERVDWMNKFLNDMWPFLDKAIGVIMRDTTKPLFDEYIGKYQVKAIDFESLCLGSLPPTVQGVKACETNENALVIDSVIKWAGNPNITLVIKLLFLRITVQLVDLQVFLAPRIVLKPLVPTFPCFANVSVTLLEKPHIDFGLKLWGGDLMAIPGLYRYTQEFIKKQVASLYLWPQTLEIPILDGSVGTLKKPVGILHVKVVRAMKLLKMDLIGASDPYVKLSLSGERLPAKKTSIKMKNLNPEWNEDFKLLVKDPETQVLQLHVYDWEKLKTHDKLGMQVIPLRSLVPNETQTFTLNLLKNTDPNDYHNRKSRGQIVVEMTLVPFRTDDEMYLSGHLDQSLIRERSERLQSISEISAPISGASLLQVTIQGAEEVEGKHHTNPYAVIHFKGEARKTKTMKKTRHPCWNEDFEFVLEEPLTDEKIRIEVISRGRRFSFNRKEFLGHIDINLDDVVYNGRINEKYHLINSKNGILHVDIKWKMT
uniref:Synaptotagmin-3-like n=1 Tax=Kalanchoe fedtschenkoi TaxID=63787 RepID=A0A7N0V5Q2_KALFE